MIRVNRSIKKIPGGALSASMLAIPYQDWIFRTPMQTYRGKTSSRFSGSIFAIRNCGMIKPLMQFRFYGGVKDLLVNFGLASVSGRIRTGFRACLILSIMPLNLYVSVMSKEVSVCVLCEIFWIFIMSPVDKVGSFWSEPVFCCGAERSNAPPISIGWYWCAEFTVRTFSAISFSISH